MRENLFGAPRGFGLAEPAGRIGGRDRQNLDVETARGRGGGGGARLGPDTFQHMELPACPARCINTARVLDRPAVTKFLRRLFAARMRPILVAQCVAYDQST